MRPSIRRQLTITFIGLAIGPLLLVGAVLAWQSFTKLQQQALDLQSEMAKRVATQVAAFFEDLENQLRLIVRVQGLADMSRHERQSVLAELLHYQNAFEELVLLDARGRMLASASRLNLVSIRKEDWSEELEFSIPRTTGRYFYGPVRFKIETGEPSMDMGIPLFDIRSGMVQAVLVVEARLKKIWDLIASVQVKSGQTVYILDSSGNVVAHRNPSVVLRGLRFDLPERDGIQEGLSASRVVLAVNTVTLGLQSLHVVVEQVVSEALRLAFNTVLITSILLLSMLVLSGTLGSLMVRQIVQPVQAMAEVARSISAGDLSQRVPASRLNELNVLAGAFNSMTVQLGELIRGLKREVRDRKNAESALRESEFRYRTVSELSSDFAYALRFGDDGSLRPEWMTSAFTQTTGYSLETIISPEFIGKAVHPDDLDIVEKQLDLVRSGETSEFETRIIRPDGEVRWVHVYNRPWFDESGGVVGIHGSVQDVTERKQSQIALQESEHKFRSVVQNARAIVFILDNNGVFLLSEGKALAKLGLRPGQVVGMSALELFRDNPVVVADLKKALAGELSHSISLVRDVAFENAFSPYFNTGGKQIGVVGVSIDITERFQAEEKIRQLNEELERRVAERTSDLEAAVKELEAFSYSVSHDLRAPLRAISGYASIFMEEYGSVLDADARRVCGVVKGEAARMGQLIEDLLSLSRLGGKQMQRVSTGMQELVSSAIQEIVGTKGGEHADIRVDALPAAVCDPSMIRQVWVNLLANAVKFSSKRERPVVEVGGRRDSGGSTYWVRDNGVGFDRQYADKLFGVFQRLHSESEFEGTGVGLAIAQRVISRHGGRIWAEGETDRGATFYFTLPGDDT